MPPLFHPTLFLFLLTFIDNNKKRSEEIRPEKHLVAYRKEYNHKCILLAAAALNLARFRIFL
jgi:hypothetical protein